VVRIQCRFPEEPGIPHQFKVLAPHEKVIYLMTQTTARIKPGRIGMFIKERSHRTHVELLTKRMQLRASLVNVLFAEITQNAVAFARPDTHRCIGVCPDNQDVVSVACPNTPLKIRKVLIAHSFSRTPDGRIGRHQEYSHRLLFQIVE
jgi:hypothetical protein